VRAFIDRVTVSLSSNRASRAHLLRLPGAQLRRLRLLPRRLAARSRSVALLVQESSVLFLNSNCSVKCVHQRCLPPLACMRTPSPTTPRSAPERLQADTKTASCSLVNVRFLHRSSLRPVQLKIASKIPSSTTSSPASPAARPSLPRACLSAS
jgi:hypothetical protein